MKIRTLSFLLIISLILPSCVNLAKRFRTHGTKWVHDDDVKKYVTIQSQSFNILPAPKPASTPAVAKDVFSLSAEGQAELIKALAGKDKKENEQLMETLALNKKAAGESPAAAKIRIFPMEISKSMVFTVDRLWAAPGATDQNRFIKRIGDRIANLEFSVNIAGLSPLKFNSWDKFVTDLVTVDLGKVSSSQQWSASANLNLNLTDNVTDNAKSTLTNTLLTKTGKADIGSSDSSKTLNNVDDDSKQSIKGKSLGSGPSLSLLDKYETSLNLLLSRMKLSGYLSDRKITLRQEGSFGTDLSGNIAISLDYAFVGGYARPITVFKFSPYYDHAVITPLNELKATRTLWLFPNIESPVMGQLQYKYLYRHVAKKSAKHIPEARQRARYFYGEHGYPINDKTDSILLVKPEDLIPFTYRLGYGQGKTVKYICWNGETIDFEKIDEAAGFLEYLMQLSPVKNLPVGDLPTDIKTLTIFKFQHKADPKVTSN